MADDNGYVSYVRGAEDVAAALELTKRKVDAATRKALKKVQAVTKASIKSGMRGRPRWDHRGTSGRTGAGVNLMLKPKVVKKSGGPGKLTGDLNRSIRGSKRPRKIQAGNFSGVVFAGGQQGYQNNYKAVTESKYPYFAPGVKKATPKMPKVWEAAWAKAMPTNEGE